MSIMLVLEFKPDHDAIRDGVSSLPFLPLMNNDQTLSCTAAVVMKLAAVHYWLRSIKGGPGQFRMTLFYPSVPLNQ